MTKFAVEQMVNKNLYDHGGVWPNARQNNLCAMLLIIKPLLKSKTRAGASKIDGA